MVVYVRYTGNLLQYADLFRASSDGTHELRLTRNRPMKQATHCVSSDGKTIAYVRGREIRAIQWDGTDDRLLVDLPSGDPYVVPMCFEPNTRKLYYKLDREESSQLVYDLRCYDLATGVDAFVYEGTHLFSTQGYLMWHPDGDYMLVGRGDDNKVRAWYPQANAVAPISASDMPFNQFYTFSRDGRYLHFIGGTAGRQLFRLDLLGGTPELLATFNSQRQPAWLAISADGSYAFVTVYEDSIGEPVLEKLDLLTGDLVMVGNIDSDTDMPATRGCP
ncbi:MAG: WD40 repeat domain-containing protein [Fimbriimonas sp.]